MSGILDGISKKNTESNDITESYWGGPSPAQLRFNRALKKQQNSPENKADREKFQKEIDRIMGPRPVQPKDEPQDKEITEAFDQPYPYEWDKPDPRSYHALAFLDDGSPLDIEFNRQGNNEWHVKFDRNYSYKVTGEGNQQRVFATVIAAMKEFVKKRKPQKVVFSATKTVAPGQKSTSRSSLYSSLISRFATALGYTAHIDDQDDHVVYTLMRVQKPVAEDSSIPKAESGKAVRLSNLGKFHKGVDTLGKWVPERLTHQFALDPDKWERTFYSLTLKDPKKIRFYRPENVDIIPGTLVGDMAIANQFYRAKDPEEQEKYAKAYLASLKPYPVNLDDYKFPELLIPRLSLTESTGKTDAGYTWRFEPGREVPMKPGVDANTFIRVKDPTGKTVCGIWADVDGDSIQIEYSQVFDEELRGRGVYTDLLRSLSKQYNVISDKDNNNAATSIYKRLGADYDHRQATHTLRKQTVEEGKLNFEEGDCPIFAIALHRLSKMPLMALVEYDDQMGGTVLIHAYVRLDDRWRLDASGETDVDWMLQKYPNNGHAEEIEISEKDLLELGYGKSKCPTLQQVLPHAKEVLQNIEEGQQGVAEGEHAPSSLKSMVDVSGIQLNVAIDGAEVSIRPVVDGYQAGYVVFDRDGRTLVPDDLAIDDEFRGRGIAKIIYDYVKSLGFTIKRSSDQTRAGKHFWDKNRGEDSQVWEQTMTAKELDEACWKGYHKEGMKTMFGKRYPNCVKNTNEDHQQCPECGGPMFSEEMINEKKDACYYKVKSRYKVWPSAYASGALVQCRKKGSSNWGTKSESSILEGLEQTDENLHKWFKEKWVRFGPDGKIRGDCARGDDSEGKPKCLPQSKAQNLGKKGRASAAARKRREDPNPERSGKAINVATKKKTSESSILQGISETKGLPMPGSYEQEYGPFKKKGGYRIMTLTSEQEELDEKWSDKYKRSIDCNHPKGFSQRAHCQGRKKK